MHLHWTLPAVFDLEEIGDYIRQDNPKAATRILALIRKKTKLLPSNPYLGRPGHAPTTRELVISGTPYLAIYRINRQTIELLRILHGARDWQNMDIT